MLEMYDVCHYKDLQHGDLFTVVCSPGFSFMNIIGHYEFKFGQVNDVCEDSAVYVFNRDRWWCEQIEGGYPTGQCFIMNNYTEVIYLGSYKGQMI